MVRRIIKISFLTSFLFICCCSTLFGTSLNNRITKTGNLGLTGDKYITGDDGVARMVVNIWGHVKTPGTYLMYDSIDMLTCLAIAGGPLRGADLKNIKIISANGEVENINLNKIISSQTIPLFKLNPYDTIILDEKFGSFLLSKSNLISTILQIFNLALYIKNND